jgi:N-acetyl sugar amidotransferase
MKYCGKCLMPDTRPRVVFHGHICNACLRVAKIEKNDYLARERELHELVAWIKREQKGPYDCIVPWSGGKDSSAVALHLKNDFGLNPLLVTFNPLCPTPTGRHNRNALLRHGFDSIYIEPNKKVSAALSLRFFIERGNPKLHWDAGINSSIFQQAVTRGIKTIFYAEHGETMYGGKVLHEKSEKIRDHNEVVEHQIGDYPENWADESAGIRPESLAPYLMPSQEDLRKSGLTAYYFGYFFPWDVVQNFKYVKSEIDFQTHPKGRTCGTATDFDSLDDYMDDIYYYLQYIKFGFGRAVRDLSRQIQFGKIKRKNALALARKYDGEFPHESLPKVLKFLNISKQKFTQIVDLHRPPKIWVKDSGKWHHKHESKLYQGGK